MFDFIKKLSEVKTSMAQPTKDNRVNNSGLSDRVKPVFLTAYEICQEFGYEYDGYYKYLYKNKIIEIYHIHESGNIEAFGIGKTVRIFFKGKKVFDCCVNKNGAVISSVFEHGEWEKYFSVLKQRVEDTKKARALCSEIYSLMEKLERRRAATVSRSYIGRSPKNGMDRYRYVYRYSDGNIGISLVRDDGKIASAAKVQYKGVDVFDATHWYPSDKMPHSTNTRCDLYKRGPWEQYMKGLK